MGKEQWYAKFDILRLTVRYLNATINRNTRNTETEIGTHWSSQTRQNPPVDGDGSGIGPPRRCGSGFLTVLEPNRTVYPVQTCTAGGLPGPVPNTTWNLYWPEAATYRGSLELDDLVFGNSWTRYWVAHSWYNYDIDTPCWCKEHDFRGTHETEGHAPAAAETAKPLEIPVIVVEPPTPTPSVLN
jgi:hypothetical protein